MTQCSFFGWTRSDLSVICKLYKNQQYKYAKGKISSDHDLKWWFRKIKQTKTSHPSSNLSLYVEQKNLVSVYIHIHWTDQNAMKMNGDQEFWYKVNDDKNVIFGWMDPVSSSLKSRA